MFRPDTPAVITRWTADCEIVGVKVDRDYLHRELGRVLGRPDRRLPDQVDLSTEAGQTWMALLRSIVQQARGGEGLWQTPVVAEQLSGAITARSYWRRCPTTRPRPRGRGSSSGSSTGCTTTRPSPGLRARWPRWRV